MKKLKHLVLLMALTAFQCTSGDSEIDCGCDSKIVLKTLSEEKARIEKVNQTLDDRIFYILPDNDQGGNFPILMACDSLVFSNGDFVDGSFVSVSGDVVPRCPSMGRRASNGIKISEVKLVGN